MVLQITKLKVAVPMCLLRWQAALPIIPSWENLRNTDFTFKNSSQGGFFILSYFLPLLPIVCLYSVMLHTLYNKVGREDRAKTTSKEDYIT